MKLLNRFSGVFDTLAKKIEQAEVLDAAADPAAEGAGRLVSGPTVRSLLGGTPLGHPLHPLLVTVPIGAWATAAALDALGNKPGARSAVGVGVLVAPLAAAAGVHDWATTQGGERRVGWVHGLLNTVTLGLYAASWVARRRGNDRLGVLLTLPGLALLGTAGWLGGHLSYARGVGVDVTAFEPEIPEWVDVAASTDVQHGQLTGVSAEDTPVLLTRDADGTPRALADRCTHRGAPLHEGQVEDGCVRCPWHDSLFDLRSGTVVMGPASRPQPVLEVSEREGRLLVRRPAGS
ncbi:Rieske 2Fe-2S domain-containing protein [Auraticoccus monumenti]|uniref:Ferredoxin subunit of nitrite reductase or a ring-hydroxylating dioxygenase n=1 Tax=Auraticoccus monumenti TaxID=675864 RepID=A0A1G6ZVD1_9ACTN|nr:Rieske 2Fe-2S domain-containing protein [Auraticoccus monumenti]SDE06694.1 Ferredoxin subunit of nitrite reductase or a ring-hydroxylating dioxygenase [Auraticoccus monumenti]